MIIKYKQEEAHFIEAQMYQASESGMVKRNMMIGRFVFPVIFLIIGLLMSLSRQDYAFIIIWGVAAAFYFFRYPSNYRKKVKKNTIAYTKELYGYLFDVETECIIEDGLVTFKDDTVKKTVKVEEFEYLTELKDIFMLKMKRGMVEIIPKNAIPDLDKFRETFINMNVYYINDTHWKW